MGSAWGQVVNPKGRLSLWAGAGETPQATAIQGGRNQGSLIMQTPTQGMLGSWRDSQENT